MNDAASDAEPDRMQEVQRIAQAVRELKASVTGDFREPIERKLRRWQRLRTPPLPDLVQSVRPYDPAWPALYAAAGERLRILLGPLARRIEHIGSTAIPGMASKGILDLLLAVPEIPAARARLAGAGYDDFGVSPCDHEAVWLWDTSPPGHSVIVHLCADDSPWIATAVNFRDYMIEHPEECAGYERLKQELRAAGRGLLEYSILKLKLFYQLSERADAWVESGRPEA